MKFTPTIHIGININIIIANTRSHIQLTKYELDGGEYALIIDFITMPEPNFISIADQELFHTQNRRKA